MPLQAASTSSISGEVSLRIEPRRTGRPEPSGVGVGPDQALDVSGDPVPPARLVAGAAAGRWGSRGRERHGAVVGVVVTVGHGAGVEQRAVLGAPVVGQRPVQQVGHAGQGVAQGAAGLDQLRGGLVVLTGPLLATGVGPGHAAAGVDRVRQGVHQVDDAAVGTRHFRDGVDVAGAADVNGVVHGAGIT
jgi:hypothetical protein